MGARSVGRAPTPSSGDRGSPRRGSTNRKDVGGAPTTSAASCPAPGPWDPVNPIRRRPLLSGSETLPPASGAAIGGGPGPPLPVLRSEPRETPRLYPASALGRLSRSTSFQTGLLFQLPHEDVDVRRLPRNQGGRAETKIPCAGDRWFSAPLLPEAPWAEILRNAGSESPVLDHWSSACPPKVEISDGGGSRSSYLRDLGDVVYFEGMGRLGMHTIKLDFALISRGLMEMVREAQATSRSSCWL